MLEQEAWKKICPPEKNIEIRRRLFNPSAFTNLAISGLGQSSYKIKR